MPKTRPPAENGGSHLRCPKCRSWDVAFEPLYGLSKLECRACGNYAYVDWTDSDTWDPAKPTPPKVFAEAGRLVSPDCASCGSRDATAVGRGRRFLLRSNASPGIAGS